jgi:hypothetical protein
MNFYFNKKSIKVTELIIKNLPQKKPLVTESSFKEEITQIFVIFQKAEGKGTPSQLFC